MKPFLTVILILFISFNILPQEVIKEKVEIKPSLKNNHNKTASSTHSIFAEFTWDLPDSAGVILLAKCENWVNGGNDWTKGGYSSVTLNNALAGTYMCRCVVNIDTGVVCHGHFTIYGDGSVIHDQDLYFDTHSWGGTSWYYQYDFVPPNYFSSLNLEEDDNMCSSG
jgi:hypothetical protein